MGTHIRIHPVGVGHSVRMVHAMGPAPTLAGRAYAVRMDYILWSLSWTCIPQFQVMSCMNIGSGGPLHRVHIYCSFGPFGWHAYQQSVFHVVPTRAERERSTHIAMPVPTPSQKRDQWRIGEGDSDEDGDGGAINVISSDVHIPQPETARGVKRHFFDHSPAFRPTAMFTNCFRRGRGRGMGDRIQEWDLGWTADHIDATPASL